MYNYNYSGGQRNVMYQNDDLGNRTDTTLDPNKFSDRSGMGHDKRTFKSRGDIHTGGHLSSSSPVMSRAMQLDNVSDKGFYDSFSSGSGFKNQPIGGRMNETPRNVSYRNNQSSWNSTDNSNERNDTGLVSYPSRSNFVWQRNDEFRRISEPVSQINLQSNAMSEPFYSNQPKRGRLSSGNSYSSGGFNDGFNRAAFTSQNSMNSFQDNRMNFSVASNVNYDNSNNFGMQRDNYNNNRNNFGMQRDDFNANRNVSLNMQRNNQNNYFNSYRNTNFNGFEQNHEANAYWNCAMNPVLPSTGGPSIGSPPAFQMQQTNQTANLSEDEVDETSETPNMGLSSKITLDEINNHTGPYGFLVVCYVCQEHPLTTLSKTAAMFKKEYKTSYTFNEATKLWVGEVYLDGQLVSRGKDANAYKCKLKAAINSLDRLRRLYYTILMLKSYGGYTAIDSNGDVVVRKGKLGIQDLRKSENKDDPGDTDVPKCTPEMQRKKHLVDWHVPVKDLDKMKKIISDYKVDNTNVNDLVFTSEILGKHRKKLEKHAVSIGLAVEKGGMRINRYLVVSKKNDPMSIIYHLIEINKNETHCKYRLLRPAQNLRTCGVPLEKIEFVPRPGKMNSGEGDGYISRANPNQTRKRWKRVKKGKKGKKEKPNPPVVETV